MRSYPVYSVAFIILLAVLCVPFGDFSGASEETAAVKGNVTDVEGNAVQGAMVFAYTNPDVRRSADFISAPTDKDGLFRMVMPPGKYWLIARFKRSEGFGPLMPGDKHSGDPGELELPAGSEVDMDFIVADLKDAVRIKRESTERPKKISGRISDEKDVPVRGAYAVAYKNKNISRIPDYLSAWVDDEGHYTLYVPEGIYSLGVALAFPPDHNYLMYEEMVIDTDKPDLDMVMKSNNGK